jgi:hypothetical protein
MKIVLIFSLLNLIWLQNSYAQEIDSTSNTTTAFKSDEELIYKVAYGLIKGGEASLVIRTVPVGDTYLFHITAMAETTGMIGAMVTIRDIYESYVDISTGYPVKSIRNIKEHNYTAYNEVLFFRDKGFLRSLNSGDHEAPSDIHDILSAFYFARRYMFSNQLKENDIITLDTYFDEQFLPIKIKFKEIEIVKTRFGKIKCLKFVPLLENNKVFKEEEQLQIWVTADQNFIPVKIRVKLPIGSLKCDIIDFKGIRYEDGELKK